MESRWNWHRNNFYPNVLLPGKIHTELILVTTWTLNSSFYFLLAVQIYNPRYVVTRLGPKSRSKVCSFYSCCCSTWPGQQWQQWQQCPVSTRYLSCCRLITVHCLTGTFCRDTDQCPVSSSAPQRRNKIVNGHK